jgi:hypothetical protein
MVRNNPDELRWAVLVLLFAGLITAVGAFWKALGARSVTVVVVVLVTGVLGWVVWVGADSHSERENPSIQIGLERIADGIVVRAKATGTSLRSNERMLLQVLQLSNPPSRFEREEKICNGDWRELHAYPRVGVRLLSWQVTGPDSKGTATTEVTVPLKNPRAGSHFCAYAALRNRLDDGAFDKEEARNSWGVVRLAPD